MSFSVFSVREITTQTREGTDIPNSQVFDFSEQEYRDLQDIISEYSHCTFRTNMIPVFNCHGLTFASRRTGLVGGKEIEDILKDDKYEVVQDTDIIPGDIIVYYSEDGDKEHSGIVMTEPDPTLGIPKILSKWGKGPEVIHNANNCPYDFTNHKYYRVTK